VDVARDMIYMLRLEFYTRDQMSESILRVISYVAISDVRCYFLNVATERPMENFPSDVQMLAAPNTFLWCY